MVWIKGSRCGIGNCSSQFYQVLAGQRVCQNGHVQEGLETTGDEDDYNAIGQKIRPRRTQSQLSSQKSKEVIVLRGKEARLATLKLMQVILRHQVNFVKKTKNLSDDLDSAAKQLWAIYLEERRHEKGFSMAHLVGIIYLATRVINAPVLLLDFHHWITKSEMPYLDCWRILDREALKHLPAENNRQFRPAPDTGAFQLHKVTQWVKTTFTDASKTFPNLKFHPIDDRYVCFRFCRDLLLPPHIYVGAIRLLSIIDKPATGRKGSLSLFEEVPAICAILISVKLYYGLDDIMRQSPDDQSNLINWAVWRDMVKKTWLLQPEPIRADERMVYLWDNEQMDQYMLWYERNIIPPTTKLDRRLEAMFPIPYLGEPQTLHPDDEILKELCALVQSTEDPKPVLNDPNLPEPGTCFPAFTVRSDLSDDLPETLHLLYNVTGQLLGASEEKVRRAVRSYEQWLKIHVPTFRKNNKEAAENIETSAA